MVLLSPPHWGNLLIGFLSCKRFVGTINIWTDRVRVGFDAENISIAPGERWVLDSVILVTSADRDAALTAFAERTARINQARADSRLHTGWSSWNVFGGKSAF
jgi:hypothetical protein